MGTDMALSITDLFNIELPIIQAPMAGASGSEMAIAVNDIETLNTLIHPVIFGIAEKLRKSGFTEITDIKVHLETRNNRSKLISGLFIASYVSGDYLQQHHECYSVLSFGLQNAGHSAVR